jgi:putative NIF3 family GTP cyclohydrolase 1 type 2
MSGKQTVGGAVEAMVKGFGVKPWPGTVDTLKIGNPKWPLRGVVTTFMPTMGVLQKAARLGANLVVTHEPLWYDHRDETAWLRGDPVYAAKRRFLVRHRMAVFRTHDTWHARRPDGILEGQVAKLGWGRYRDAEGSNLFRFPRWTVRRIAGSAKTALGIPAIRLVGDPEMVPRTVAYSCGFGGGRNLIGFLRRPGIDAVVCGEDHEWESYEYVRDAALQGRRKALIVLGHEPSEEAGMQHLARWLDGRLRGVAAWHVPSGAPYKLL